MGSAMDDVPSALRRIEEVERRLEHTSHEVSTQLRVIQDTLVSLKADHRALSEIINHRISHLELRVENVTGWIKPVITPVLTALLMGVLAFIFGARLMGEPAVSHAPPPSHAVVPEYRPYPPAPISDVPAMPRPSER